MNQRAMLGLFISGALAILLAGVFVIGSQNRMFTRTYRLQAQFPTVSGLLAGAEVRLGGLRKGTVEEIRLPADPRSQVLVTLSLDAATARLVKTDSVAAIETEGLLGNKFIALTFGSPGAPEVRDGATLASAPLLDVSDLIRKTNAIMDSTQSTMKHLEASSAELATMTARINRGQGSVGALLHERTLYDSLSATAAEAHEAMVHARSGAAAFDDDMQALKANILFRGFFKDRGYQDASELTKWEVAELPAGPPARTFTFTAQALFAKPDAAQLKGRKALNEVGAYLEKTPFTLVVVRAFSGGKGDKDANKLITQGQAMVVRSYLAERFDLDDAKLRTKAMGEVTTGEPGKERWVEILVF